MAVDAPARGALLACAVSLLSALSASAGPLRDALANFFDPGPGPVPRDGLPPGRYGYPLDVQIHPDDPVRPGDMYGVTKVFGEATGAYFAYREGLSAIAVRIGAYGKPEHVTRSDDSRYLSLFVSPRDLSQLFHRCIEAPDTLRFAILHGISNNQLKRLDISSARELVGYDPQDNAFALSEHVHLEERDPNGPDA